MNPITMRYRFICFLLLMFLLAACGQAVPLTQSVTTTPSVSTTPAVETMAPLPPVETVVPTPTTEAPTQTPVPTVIPTELPTPTPTVPLPTIAPFVTEVPTTTDTSWTTVDWEGLVVSTPPTYTHEVETLTDVFVAPGVPIRSRLTLIPPGLSIAGPIRMMLEVVDGLGIDAYLDAVRQMGSEQPMIDENSVERVLVAGYPGVRYAQDQSLSTRNYVLVRPEGLLLMSLDITDAAQIGIVDALMPSPNAMPPSTTATTSSTTTTALASGELAYLQGGDIMILDLTTEQTRKVTNLGSVSDMAWSPSGDRLVFAAGSGNSDIYQIDADGTNLVRVTDTETQEFNARWADDGSLYWVRHSFGGEAPLIEVVHHTDTADTVVHTEPGGLCGPTNFRLGPADQFGLVLNCGRGTHVLIGGFSITTTFDLADTYLTPEQGCAYDVGWTEDRLVALTSVECLPQQNTALSLIDIATKQTVPLFVDQGMGSFAVSPDGNSFVFDKFGETTTAGGVWILETLKSRAPRQISANGTRGAWRPTAVAP